MKFVLLTIIVLSYFLGFFLLPHGDLFPQFAENASYLFDAIFILLFVPFINFSPLFKLPSTRKIIFTTIPIFVSSIIFILILGLNETRTPYHLIKALPLQILLLSPMVEELIFRHIFFEFFPWKLSHRKLYQVSGIIGLSLLYPLHYYLSLSYIPEIFQSFGVLQVLFSALLGLIFTFFRWKHKSVILPITLHLLFNFIIFLNYQLGLFAK